MTAVPGAAEDSPDHGSGENEDVKVEEKDYLDDSSEDDGGLVGRSEDDERSRSRRV